MHPRVAPTAGMVRTTGRSGRITRWRDGVHEGSSPHPTARSTPRRLTSTLCPCTVAATSHGSSGPPRCTTSSCTGMRSGRLRRYEATSSTARRSVGSARTIRTGIGAEGGTISSPSHTTRARASLRSSCRTRPCSRRGDGCRSSRTTRRRRWSSTRGSCPRTSRTCTRRSTASTLPRTSCCPSSRPSTILVLPLHAEAWRALRRQLAALPRRGRSSTSQSARLASGSNNTLFKSLVRAAGVPGVRRPSPGYLKDVDAKFCGVFPGNGWGQRDPICSAASRSSSRILAPPGKYAQLLLLCGAAAPKGPAELPSSERPETRVAQIRTRWRRCGSATTPRSRSPSRTAHARRTAPRTCLDLRRGLSVGNEAGTHPDTLMRATSGCWWRSAGRGRSSREGCRTRVSEAAGL